jgi:hypothetical protein
MYGMERTRSPTIAKGEQSPIPGRFTVTDPGAHRQDAGGNVRQTNPRPSTNAQISTCKFG